MPRSQQQLAFWDGHIQSLAYLVDDDGLYVPSTDSSATRETKVLLKSMADVTKMKALMFGHQNTNFEVGLSF